MRYVFISLGWGWAGLKLYALYKFLLHAPLLAEQKNAEAARVMMESTAAGAINATMVILFPALLIAGIGHIMRKNP